MTRETMITTAKLSAEAAGETIDPYWGEAKSVMKVIAACAGYSLHVG